MNKSTHASYFERIRDISALLSLTDAQIKERLIREKTLRWQGDHYLWFSSAMQCYTEEELPQQFENLRTYWKSRIRSLGKQAWSPDLLTNLQCADLTADSFEKLHLTTPAVSSTYELEQRLYQYYIITSPDSVDNGRAAACWKEFKAWTVHHGYTSADISQAKKIVSGWVF